jgi:hypothetical protein
MKCLDEGTLQAYLDSELPEARIRRAADHLEGCAHCRERLARLEAAMACVNVCLNALAPEGLDAQPLAHGAIVKVASKTRGGRWRWAAVGLAAALAAPVALLFTNAHAAKKKARSPEPPAPLVSLQGPASPQPHRTVAVRKRLPAARKTKPQSTLEGFVALDDADPIQMGIVVRVMVPVSDASMSGGVKEIAADLMIGDDGRARAIRFVE